MKKILFTAILLTFSLITFCQGNSGLGFNYQAVIRGADGFVMKSKEVELRFSLFPGQQATTATWIETHKVKTDDFGTIGVIVGKGTKTGGTVGSFADINFAGVYYWLKIELVEGAKITLVSYTQLTSVPYAEVANNAVSSPVGSVMPFAGDASKVPAGWLLCDGRAVSRSDYAALYNVIGTAWGFGNNSTTFNLPDMRGVFLRGVSGDSGKDEDTSKRTPSKEGGNSGNDVGSYQKDAIRNIKGSFQDAGESDGIQKYTPPFHKIGQYTDNKTPRQADDSKANIVEFDASLSVQIGSDNRPQNVYVNYIIKY